MSNESLIRFFIGSSVVNIIRERSIEPRDIWDQAADYLIRHEAKIGELENEIEEILTSREQELNASYDDGWCRAMSKCGNQYEYFGTAWKLSYTSDAWHFSTEPVSFSDSGISRGLVSDVTKLYRKIDE